jgi:hypothetical protein
MTVRRLLVLCCLCGALLPGLACTGEEESPVEEAPRLTAGEAKAIAGVDASLRKVAAADRFSGAALVAKDGRDIGRQVWRRLTRDHTVDPR